ncbi:hypothetical protein [Sphingomonas sp. Leaf4]|uniref:hypothetical protein n=1 Tax=Sphingomonas sp. Leaf4 TaxID=2876553 RepID=UPI001E3434A7|nr:hypothetical protein [Sphingomonas sp. Leaf4]
MGILTLCGGFMAMQFEKRPEGYLYRVNGKGPAWPVTQRDYVRFVRRAGVSFLLHVVALCLSIVAAAMLTSLVFPRGGEVGGMVMMGGFLLLIGVALYRSLVWAMRAPVRALAGQAPIDAPSAAPPPPRRAAKATAAPPMTWGKRLLFVGYLVAEAIGAIVALVVVSGWASGWGDAAAAIAGLVAAIATMFAIDRLCKRHTGESVIESLPFLP